ncbi:MAG: hypothetical protein AAF601_13615 [Pseudomonadota bacterium]
MPRSVLITTASLTILAGALGFWFGQRQVTLDSSAVIQAVAERHISEHGGRIEDCIGLPGQGRAVFHVQCAQTTYAVDRLGRVRLIEDGGI